MARQQKPNLTGCQGWNFHVYAIGADRCSVCGEPKWHTTDTEEEK